MTEKTIHEGRNVKRIREMLGIKQDALAFDLGLSQQAISALEQKEALDKDMLQKIAAVLKVPVEAIKNFDEEKANNFFNTFNDSSTGAFNNFHCTFNPIDKVVQLYDEKIALYERMLKDKSDMIEKLEELLLKGKS
jgi:transcriptional regulator with XRE-family HTH domain